MIDGTKKPPKGLTPRNTFYAKRKKDILNAMKRYSEVKIPIPVEWIDELMELRREK